MHVDGAMEQGQMEAGRGRLTDFCGQELGGLSAPTCPESLSPLEATHGHPFVNMTPRGT